MAEYAVLTLPAGFRPRLNHIFRMEDIWFRVHPDGTVELVKED